jgi:hypothetical protein
MNAGILFAAAILMPALWTALNCIPGAITAVTKPGMCWPEQPEIGNPNPPKPGQPLSPPRKNAKTRLSMLDLKLCVNEEGKVVRVIVLKSSGDRDVDRYYVREMLKRTFAPVEREGKKVRTVVGFSAILDDMARLNEGASSDAGRDAARSASPTINEVMAGKQA